jgi:sialate O-acetylesterase
MAAVFLAAAHSLQADVKMPAIFSDHMILQANTKDAVWGWAKPGSQVKVEWSDPQGNSLASVTGTSDANGRWTVSLPPQKPGTAGELRITTGGESRTISDVLVGETWLCGGQSNMEFQMSRVLNAKTEVAAANDPQLRVFLVAHQMALTPLDDVQGQWALCTPQSVAPFSAVGYYFGKRLRAALNEPVGLIGSYWGGTMAQVWMSSAALKNTPGLERYVQDAEIVQAAYPHGQADYDAQQAAAQVAQQKWRTDINQDAGYTAGMTAWRAAVAQANAAHQPPPPQPQPPTPPPHMPPGGVGTPSILYNGMIAPLAPYTLKGVIWFQADGNMGHPDDYGLLIQTLIKDWRAQWGADLPFYYVEMNNMRDMPQTLPVQENNLSLIREQQQAALQLPATGVVCSIDVGLPVPEPHFPNKKPVGDRLANLALNDLYQQPGLVNSPAFQSYTVEGNKVWLTFSDAMGLQATTPDGTLKGFAIRAAGGQWQWAQAKIEKNSIVVWSDQVSQPSDVRYAWAPNPVVSVANSAGLPLRPFRTDTKSPQ